MDVEPLFFYESERNDANGYLSGTMHVRLPEIGIELRGIYVLRKKDFWLFRLPDRLVGDGKYPIFAFSDRAQTDEFYERLTEKGRPFIEAYILANPQPQERLTEVKAEPHKKVEKRPGEPLKPEKKPAPIARPLIKARIWSDPPKRSSQKEKAVLK
jgi:hypothetical protein